MRVISKVIFRFHNIAIKLYLVILGPVIFSKDRIGIFKKTIKKTNFGEIKCIEVLTHQKNGTNVMEEIHISKYLTRTRNRPSFYFLMYNLKEN